jgi:hypothetical protein
LAFRRPLIVRSLVKPQIQCVKVDVKDKDTVKQIDKFEKFLEPPQKKVAASSWFATKAFTLSNAKCGARVRSQPSAHQFPDRLDSQFAVTMNGMVAAPLQFIADRSFAGAGNAFNQIISHAPLPEDNNNEP